VITADPPGHRPFGLTVNSFASLSLAPPLVLWSLQKTSDTTDAFRVATQYCVNVLSQEQQPLSARFARKGEHALHDGEYHRGKTGLPVLHGVLCCFECEIDARHDGGDHIILVGRVLGLHVVAGGRALVFYEGGYHELK
jgi:flavin reductase (DIM6/NTAB) family NADH-FMN oxidoreductase RutF